MAGNEVTSGRPNTINLMLVRHGQSTNNPLFEELHAEVDAGRISATELQQRWMKNRMEDPPLTPKGKVPERAYTHTRVELFLLFLGPLL